MSGQGGSEYQDKGYTEKDVSAPGKRGQITCKRGSHYLGKVLKYLSKGSWWTYERGLENMVRGFEFLGTGVGAPAYEMRSQYLWEGVAVPSWELHQ